MTHAVWLVRHASTAWTGIRWTGARSDPTLSEEGRRTARALAAELAARLPPGTPVLSSPSRRAVQTANSIAAALRVQVELDRELREVDVGELDGRTFDETAAAYPDLARQVLAADSEIDWPGGERAASLRNRAAAAWRGALARAGDGSIVVVTHGGVVGELVASLVDTDPSEPRSWLAAGAAIELVRHGDGWAVHDRVEPDGPGA
jgi:ribonuclease H / adenosylcobalamin/alpha-ribazole phosphatase